MKLGLARIKALLAALGHPETKFASIHITGTNGKGSVSAMTENILRHSGLVTGLFISPHLEDWRERIQISGKPVGEDDFALALSAIKDVTQKVIAQCGEAPTQFEILTAAAFWLFARAKVDYAVVEVGLGGLYDSTNVIMPKLSVITNVSLEHEDKCGGTLEGVAKHKAGIIKDNVPLVTAAEGMPLEVILHTAQEHHSAAYIYGRDFTSTVQSFGSTGQEIFFDTTFMPLLSAKYYLPLIGRHQARNAAVALMSVYALKDNRISRAAVAEGLRSALWPGRLEILHPAGLTLILDGAHNPAGAKALRETLDEYFPTDKRRFVLGILRDKNISAILQTLLRPEDEVIVTRPDSPRAAEPDDLCEAVRKICPARAVREPKAALAAALSDVTEDKLIIVCGSLYLVGALRAEVVP